MSGIPNKFDRERDRLERALMSGLLSNGQYQAALREIDRDEYEDGGDGWLAGDDPDWADPGAGT